MQNHPSDRRLCVEVDLNNLLENHKTNAQKSTAGKGHGRAQSQSSHNDKMAP